MMEGNTTLGESNVFLILQGENQYGVLDVLMREFQIYLETHTDYNVKRIDCTAEGGMDKMLSELTRAPACVFCLEGVCFDLKIQDGRYLLSAIIEMFQTKVLGWIVDPSFYHHSRLSCMTGEMKVAMVDQYETLHVREEYGVAAYTLYHFGLGPRGDLSIREREIDVFLPCSFETVSSVERELLSMVPDPFDRSLIQRMTEIMLQDSTLLNWDALTQALLEFGVDVTGADVDKELKIVEGWADRYYRAKLRERCIFQMLKAGITLTVCGKGWEYFTEEVLGGEADLRGRLDVIGENMSYEDVINTMDHAKIVLNIFPFFREGLHERICTAMLHGAVCLTDPSEYLLANFTNGENILFFQWDSLEESFQQVITYLRDEGQLQQMADNAFEIAKEKLTVERFAKQVLDILDV